MINWSKFKNSRLISCVTQIESNRSRWKKVAGSNGSPVRIHIQPSVVIWLWEIILTTNAGILLWKVLVVSWNKCPVQTLAPPWGTTTQNAHGPGASKSSVVLCCPKQFKAWPGLLPGSQHGPNAVGSSKDWKEPAIGLSSSGVGASSTAALEQENGYSWP